MSFFAFVHITPNFIFVKGFLTSKSRITNISKESYREWFTKNWIFHTSVNKYKTYENEMVMRVIYSTKMNTNDAITRVWETKANFMDLLCMILSHGCFSYNYMYVFGMSVNIFSEHDQHICLYLQVIF